MKATVPASIFAACIIAVSAPAPSWAKTNALPGAGSAVPQENSSPEAIAAVVDADVISSYDVANRMRFIILTSKMSDTPDVLARIRPEVIQMLINEKLKMEEGAKNDIKIDDKKVGDAIAAIESQRGMPPGTIFKLLEDNHLPKETFTSQIRSELTWTKLVGKKLRPDIKITDEEVELAQAHATASPAAQAAMAEELQIAVLALPVEKPSHDAQAKALAEKLVSQVRGGASFEEVSRQFAPDATSAGGQASAFWVRPQELDPAIGRVLATAKPGTLTDPIRTDQGYTIVKVYNTRAAANEVAAAAQNDSELLLKQILLKLKPDADPKEAEVLLQIGEDVAKHPGTCEDKGIANIQDLQDFDITVDFRRGRMSELPSGLKAIASNLSVGQSSTPFASNEGIRLFMLCEKKDVSAQAPDPERVRDLLFREKIELAAQKYLRNLRREAFIDIR